MDPLGLLLEIVALAVYPGGLFLAALVWLTRRTGGLPRASTLDVRGLAAIVTATVAAAMASLPGSPAASLPPPDGATQNLIAAVLLLFAAGALAAPLPWSSRRVVLVGFAGGSLVLLGLVVASFSMATISGAGGVEAATSRILAAVTALVALPLIVQPQTPGEGAIARVTVVAATVEVVLALLVPPSLQWQVATLAVLAVVVGVVLYALLLRVGRAATQREHPSLIVLAGACCAVATVAAVLAARP